MHTSACVSCVRACTNRNGKGKGWFSCNLSIFLSLMVFPCLSMSFHVFPFAHPSASQCIPVPSSAIRYCPLLLIQPEPFLDRGYSLVGSGRYIHAFNIVQCVPNRSKPGDGWDCLEVLVCIVFVLCFSLDVFWILFGLFPMMLVLGCFSAAKKAVTIAQLDAARLVEVEEPN